MFKDESVIRLNENSKIRLRRIKFENQNRRLNTKLELFSGQIWIKNRKVNHFVPLFEVKIQKVAIKSQDASFDVQMSRNHEFIAKLFTGEMLFNNNIYDNKMKKAKSRKRVRKKRMQIEVKGDGRLKKVQEFHLNRLSFDDNKWISWNLSFDTGKCGAY